MKNELITMTDSQVLQAFGSEAEINSIIQNVAGVVDGFDYDLTSVASRKKIGSLAAKVSTLKVKIDTVGKARCKELAAQTKGEIDTINKGRNTLNDELAALRDKARQPLTDFEQIEKDRVAAHVATMDLIEEISSRGLMTREAVEINTAIAEIEAIKTSSMEEFEGHADKAKADALSKLKPALEQQRESDRLAAENARMQAELEKKQQEERDAKIAQDAADQAIRDSELKHQQELTRLENEKQAAINAEIKAVNDAKAAKIKAENDRIAAEKRAADEAARAKAQEQAAKEKRLADRANVGQVRGDAKTALMELCNITEEAAKRAVMAIDKGLVPSVSISY